MKRLLFPLCILMAIVIVVVSMTTVSFSWFKPGSLSGTGLQFSETVSVRSEVCSFVTYSGENNNGVITYESEPINAGVTVSATTSGETTTPGVSYFKTVINNNSGYDTNVSLYLSTFALDSNSTASIGVAVPTNTYRTFSETKNNIHIIRNAYISTYSYESTNSGKLIVEWFIKCEEGSVTVQPNSLYVTYN